MAFGDTPITLIGNLVEDPNSASLSLASRSPGSASRPPRATSTSSPGTTRTASPCS
jgi:hypothetical protein